MFVIRTPKARRKFEAWRDDAGVPHAKTKSWLDALYAFGYLHAIDRGTQLLFARAVASGRAAEQISNRSDLLETDRFFRRAGLHLNLDREARSLEPRIQGQLQAYCDGVNDGIAGAGRSLPMWATGFRPEPWDIGAVLLVGQLLSFGGLAIGQMQNERLLVELIHAGVSDTALADLFRPRLDRVDFDMLRRVRMSNQLSNDALAVMTDLPRLAGSNAWAVAGARTASGFPYLCSDPHLEVNRLPGIWHEIVLQWGSNYVMGATLPGCPLFAVARTDRLSWGVTYMKGDTIDFFVEDCRPGGEAGWQYRRQNQWFDFSLRQEIIHRKGGTDKVLTLFENPQGTLESDPTVPGLYLSTSWTGSATGSGEAIATWLDVVLCASVKEGMDVVQDCPQPTLCFVFADRENHIGLQGTGRFPKRPDPTAGLVPLPAWESRNHWQGWLDRKWLPRIFDPPEQFISTANEGWNPPDGPLLVTQILPDYRKRRIDERLHDLPQATLKDMQNLQYDVHSLQARELLPSLLDYIPDSEQKKRLQAWDYCYDIQSHEAVLYQRLYIHLIIEIFGGDEGIGWRRIVYLCTRGGYSNMILTVADRVLLNERSPWWEGRNKRALVERAWRRTLEFPECSWGDFNYFHFTDRFFGSQHVGRLLGFQSARQPMPGCAATPFQGHVFQTAKSEQTFAPSYHFVTDLQSDDAWTNLPGGPSESRFSRFYKSDLPRWQSGEYKRINLEGMSLDD